MAKPSFDMFATMLDGAVDHIPPRFLRGLTGGFNLRKGKKREGEYYILGEYVEDDMLGCFIVFYYGSFVGLLGDQPDDCWEAEIMDTVLHEMQHLISSHKWIRIKQDIAPIYGMLPVNAKLDTYSTLFVNPLNLAKSHFILGYFSIITLGWF